MSSFASLTPQIRCAMAGLLFLAAWSELVLCMMQYFAERMSVRCIRNFCLLGGMILFLAAVTVEAHAAQPVQWLSCMPWLVIVGIAFVMIIYTTAGIGREYRFGRSRLSDYSVKQALDNLDSGILFADDTGKIILINRRMEKLISGMTGSSPRMLYDLAEMAADEKKIRQFADGQMWRFQTIPLTEKGFEGYTQITAQNVTESVEYNSRLEAENEAINNTNEKLREMYERLSDRIREQETLELKMKIHNDIGVSLIAISELLEGRSEKNVDEQLAVLREAVSYLGRGALPKTLREVVRQAENMYVGLVTEGNLQVCENAEKLIALAAQECVVNCVKHAGGNEVYLKISQSAEWVEAVFTNNGAVPKGDIEEGGGLLALRRRIEDVGGEMYVCADPEFMLTVRLPAEAKEEGL